MANLSMSPLQAAIWNFFRENYAGPDKATPRATILTRYNLIHRKEISDREFREIVSELVTVFKKGDLYDALKRLLRGPHGGREE